ncbi:hypothetical protein B0H19DRAFT_1096903 [Mycena capillaripes]|nr:hypothetical protein B0H19DRAFT_1096903 [Mycena capillaripes]
MSTPPPEILSEIFSASTTSIAPPPSPTDPSGWLAMSVVLGGTPSVYICLWALSIGPENINLSLKVTAPSPLLTAHVVLDALISTWEALRFFLDSTPLYSRASRIYMGRLTLSPTLSSTYITQQKPHCTYFPMLLGFLKVTIRVRRGHLSPETVVLPWPQLTSLRLHHQKVYHLRPFLTRCANLVHCTIGGWHRSASQGQPVAPLTLPKLKDLRIMGLEMVLNEPILPSLECFYLRSAAPHRVGSAHIYDYQLDFQPHIPGISSAAFVLRAPPRPRAPPRAPPQ